MKRLARQPAFTLIESILVLVLLSIMLAMAAPSLNHWGRGAKLRSFCDEFIAATQFARTQAVALAHDHELEIAPDGGSYQLWQVQGEGRVAPHGEWAHARLLPPGYSIAVTQGIGGPIRFYANGRVTPATLLVRDDRGRSTTIACLAAGERFSRVEGSVP